MGLAEYRAFVERVGRQVGRNQANVNRLEATVKTYLKQGDRELAGRYVLELNQARQELAENQAQLQVHERAYENNLLKIKHAGGKLAEIRNKIAKYDADLKMMPPRPRWRGWPRFPRRCHHRFRPARVFHPGEDRSEPGQGARRRGPLGRGRRLDSPGRGNSGAACRAGCRSSSVRRVRSRRSPPQPETAATSPAVSTRSTIREQS